MKKYSFKILVLIIIIVLGIILIYKPIFKNNKFPPRNIACFDSFINSPETGNIFDFKRPEFNFKNISYFRCSSKFGFDQYEIKGIDKEGHSFYIHKNQGGLAPSGADGIYNLCYKKDNVIITNIQFAGHDSIQKEGTCYWTDDFPQNPESTYVYRSYLNF